MAIVTNHLISPCEGQTRVLLVGLGAVTTTIAGVMAIRKWGWRNPLVR
jgi:hypothetical protein